MHDLIFTYIIYRILEMMVVRNSEPCVLYARSVCSMQASHAEDTASAEAQRAELHQQLQTSQQALATAEARVEGEV